MSCPDCFTGAIREGKPQGQEEILHGVRTYVAGPSPAEAQNQNQTTIIFITDAFGFNLVNSKLLADTYAIKTDYRILVPDIIPGGGVPAHSLQLMNAAQAKVAWYDVVGQIKRVVTIVRMMSIFMPFVFRTRNAYPAILEYARQVKSNLPDGGKMGVAGVCWGAMQTNKLAQEAALDGEREALVSAHFMAHPSGLKVPVDVIHGIQNYKVPCSIALGDRDMVLPKAKAEELEAGLRMALAEDERYQFEIKAYEKCGHGFAVRADATKPEEDSAAELAAEQAVSWFRRHLA